uniref:Uncharacterized protein n=1 Tax=Sphaerodactylus townsendi TaxID=933632 RepID=A0ACB8FMU2_9SAUR
MHKSSHVNMYPKLPRAICLSRSALCPLGVLFERQKSFIYHLILSLKCTIMITQPNKIIHPTHSSFNINNGTRINQAVIATEGRAHGELRWVSMHALGRLGS